MTVSGEARSIEGIRKNYSRDHLLPEVPQHYMLIWEEMSCMLLSNLSTKMINDLMINHVKFLWMVCEKIKFINLDFMFSTSRKLTKKSRNYFLLSNVRRNSTFDSLFRLATFFGAWKRLFNFDSKLSRFFKFPHYETIWENFS